MRTFLLLNTWTRVADPGGAYLISRPGTRRIVMCEAATAPAEHVHGDPCPHADLAAEPGNPDTSIVTPAAPLWLRVGDDFGAVPIGIKPLEDRSAA